MTRHANKTSQRDHCRKAVLLSDRAEFCGALHYLACRADERSVIRRPAAQYDVLLRPTPLAIAVDFSGFRWRTEAYDFNFSISAIAAAGARTFPSWMK